MITPAELEQMNQDITELRLDNEVMITLRRGNSTLSEQSVRIVRTGGSGRSQESESGQEARGQVVVLGESSLDIAPEDRFTVQGQLYRVTFVRPDRRVRTEAEGELIE